MKWENSTTNKSEENIIIDDDEDEENDVNKFEQKQQQSLPSLDAKKVKKEYEHPLLTRLRECAKQIEIGKHKERKKLKQLKFEDVDIPYLQEEINDMKKEISNEEYIEKIEK